MNKKKQKNTAKVWMYFTETPEEDAKCKICDKIIPRTKCISHQLRNHLRTEHDREYVQYFHMFIRTRNPRQVKSMTEVLEEIDLTDDKEDSLLSSNDEEENHSGLENTSGVENTSDKSTSSVINISGVINTSGENSTSGVKNISSVINTIGVKSTSGVKNISGVTNTSGVMNTSRVINTSGDKSTSGVKNISGVINTSGAIDTSGNKNTSDIQDTNCDSDDCVIQDKDDNDMEMIVLDNQPSSSGTQMKDPYSDTISRNIQRAQLLLNGASKSNNIKLTIFYITSPISYQTLEKVMPFPKHANLVDTLFENYVRLKDPLFSKMLRFKVSEMTDLEVKCFVALELIDVTPHLSYDTKHDTLYGVENFNDFEGTARKINKCLVLHICGLFTSWYIPIDMLLFEDTPKAFTNVKAWITKTYKLIETLHLQVQAFVIHSPEIGKYLEGDESCKYKMPIVDEVIDYVYSVQNLFKLFYFNLFKYDYNFPDFVMSSNFLEDYYYFDSNSKIPLTPNLTYYGTSIVSYDKISNKFLGDFFSPNTVRSLMTYIAGNKNEWINTAVDIVRKMSDLYQVLMRRNTEGISLEDEATISELIKMFYNMTVIEKNSNVLVDNGDELFVNQFLLTLQSLQHLFNTNKGKSRILKYHITCRKHTIKKFMKDERLTPEYVFNVYKTKAWERLLKPRKRKREIIASEMEISKSLTCFFHKMSLYKKTFFVNPTNKLPELHTAFKDIETLIATYKMITKDSDYWLLVTAGFILKNCINIHSHCQTFKDYVLYVTQDEANMSEHIMTHVKSGECLMPRNSFLEYIELLELKFLNMINAGSKILASNVCWNIIDKMKDIKIDVCECFPVYYSKHLFVITRIHRYCDTFNVRNQELCEAVEMSADPLDIPDDIQML